jgi:hypothetical protein
VAVVAVNAPAVSAWRAIAVHAAVRIDAAVAGDAGIAAKPKGAAVTAASLIRRAVGIGLTRVVRATASIRTSRVFKDRAPAIGPTVGAVAVGRARACDRRIWLATCACAVPCRPRSRALGIVRAMVHGNAHAPVAHPAARRRFASLIIYGSIMSRATSASGARDRAVLTAAARRDSQKHECQARPPPTV